MKYINKLAFVSLLAVFGLTACDKENERGLYDIALAPAYSLFQPALIAELVAENNGVLKVSVTRTDASSDVTVPIKIGSSTAATLNLFKLKTAEVSFAKGQSQTNAEVTFDLSTLSASSSYTFDIALIDSTYMSKGGNIKTAVTAARKITWKNIGTGIWVSSSMWGIVEADKEPVNVQQAEEAAELYRFPDFFPLPVMMTIIPTTNVASVSLQNTGMKAGSDEIYMNCKGTYDPANKIINFPKASTSNPQNYYYYKNTSGGYSAGWNLTEVIKMP